MLFKDGERPPGVPDYYIMEEHHTQYGIARVWRNPHPDPEEHEKGMRDLAEYLVECNLRHMISEGREADIEKCFGSEIDFAAQAV